MFFNTFMPYISHICLVLIKDYRKTWKSQTSTKIIKHITFKIIFSTCNIEFYDGWAGKILPLVYVSFSHFNYFTSVKPWSLLTLQRNNKIKPFCILHFDSTDWYFDTLETLGIVKYLYEIAALQYNFNLGLYQNPKAYCSIIFQAVNCLSFKRPVYNVVNWLF